MKYYFATEALLPSGWASNVRISVDETGSFAEVVVNASARDCERLAGPVLPGMANLHSHAFQRAMAGLSDTRGSENDDFWTWRELMYQFVERLRPEHAKAIATHLYIEMLKHGYTAVAEFHYVHHPAEMLLEHLHAARETGIAITMLPSLYCWSNFGRKPLTPRQKRFDTDPTKILAIWQDLKKHLSPDIRVGVAPHSLRAVDPRSLKDLLAGIDSDTPVHIHAAEQTKEVVDCMATLGNRPVAWLLENCRVNPRWCVVHATHMSIDETSALARSGAVAGLCPTTEGNLGDGMFAFPAYRANSGTYGIGGDSHVSRNPGEELRLLEYIQRLAERRRNIAVGTVSKAVGTTLWLEAAAGGGQALARTMGSIARGMRADMVILDPSHPDLAGRTSDSITNSLIFSGGENMVRDVTVGGHTVIQAGHHRLEESAERDYKRTLSTLLA